VIKEVHFNRLLGRTEQLKERKKERKKEKEVSK
jgi:hypothetical protein